MSTYTTAASSLRSSSHLLTPLENLQGRIDYLSSAEEEALTQFRNDLRTEGLLDPAKHDDHLLLRFLRARKFILADAKKMWIDCQTWRKEFGTDTLISELEFPELSDVKKYYPRFYHKVDKLGRPLYIEKLGAVDIKKLFAVTTEARLLKQHIYEYEKLAQYRLPACSKRAGRHLEQTVVVMDLAGVYLSSFPSITNMVSNVSSIAQNYYPETLGKMYIINAPFLFTTVWMVVKQFLDEATIAKINILGSNYKDALLECIDAENLPAFLGGSCTCKEGCEHSDIGPWNDGSVDGFPQELYERMDVQYCSVDYKRHISQK